ncbi:MAG: hypothetical protein LRS47_04080 [Desulfurococcales archaeon]|nr:hypothetical protein [Desulfurococcales archaeon]
MHPGSRQKELLDLILSAGLVEDFVSWYRRKYGTIEVPSLKEISPSVIEEYAENRGLIHSSDPVEEVLRANDEILQYEPLEVKPRIQPKKH